MDAGAELDRSRVGVGHFFRVDRTVEMVLDLGDRVFFVLR